MLVDEGSAVVEIEIETGHPGEMRPPRDCSLMSRYRCKYSQDFTAFITHLHCASGLGGNPLSEFKRRLRVGKVKRDH